jgi:preprotein translocase SecE subunit
MSSVAVKTPESTSRGPLDRLHVGVFAGVVYVLGSLAILFRLLPWFWFDQLGLDRGSPTAFAGSVIVGLLVAGALGYLGMRLLGPQPTPGIKAGIFTTLVCLLLIVLLTRWASLYVESWVYESRAIGETTGILITAGVGLVLLAIATRFVFLAPTFGSKMVAFEEQGWFGTRSFKRSQGQKVRRGTILGILILAGCGIYSLNAHGSLKGTDDWAVNIPFTGKATITALNDAVVTLGPTLAPREPEGTPQTLDAWVRDTRPTVDLATFRDKNNDLKAHYVKIDQPNDAAETFEQGQVVPKDVYDKVRRSIVDKKEKEPTIKTPEPATGVISYQHLTLLPHVRYTLPIVLAALSLWFAWRIVNVPSFADFLIATEAELNKVSWTTRRRLVQDTIVVLVTVILFTVFLFVVDVAWGKILSWRPIGVLKMPEGSQATQSPEQNW